MSRKSASRRRSRQAEPAGDGLVAHLVDRVFENPATSGGLLVMALTATAIVSNAMFLQSGHHPGPLFSAPAARPARAFNLPQLAPAAIDAPLTAPATHANPPPLPRLSPVSRIAGTAAPAFVAVATARTPPPVPPADIPLPRDTQTKLTLDVQRELARLGLYTGPIDGHGGPQTAAAIAAYQRAAGLKPSGIPSQILLTALRQPVAAASPAADPAFAPAGVAAGDLDARTKARSDAIALAERDQVALRARENCRIVQGALNRIGYGPVNVTGVLDQETGEAIRRFELDNGLDITGEINDAVIARLIAIGAVRAT